MLSSHQSPRIIWCREWIPSCPYKNSWKELGLVEYDRKAYIFLYLCLNEKQTVSICYLLGFINKSYTLKFTFLKLLTVNKKIRAFPLLLYFTFEIILLRFNSSWWCVLEMNILWFITEREIEWWIGPVVDCVVSDARSKNKRK